MSRRDYLNKKLQNELNRFSRYLSIAVNEKELPGLRNDANRGIPAIRDRIQSLQEAIENA